MEGDLHAGHAGLGADLLDEIGRRVPVLDAVTAEQHHAVAVAALGVVVLPHALGVEPDQRLHPGVTAVEVRPLVGEAQVHLDDAAADGLEVDHARVAGEVALQPLAAVALDGRARLGQHGPVVEHAALERRAVGVTPPPRAAVDHRDVGGDVLALQQRHPDVARPLVGLVLAGRAYHARADAHAAHVEHRLGEHRVGRRLQSVGPALEALALGHRELVVDPAEARVPAPGVPVLGGYEDILRTGHVLEVLHPPRVGFAYGHDWLLSRRADGALRAGCVKGRANSIGRRGAHPGSR